ncbi:hypothetical protein U9M48_004967 [Paspalum notatum var. saurae]|uniref:Uncharacterized protein n=1 Tax=Paspalum notatum var. saurae TaxID=547442 RepID=A0AAQ3PWD4_PASNO
MKSIPYASAVGSIMYAQVCTRPDLAFTTGMLGRYQKNPGVEHWIAVKKTLQYLQGTKSLMLTYRKSNALEIVGYSDADWAGCKDTRKSTSGYIFILARGAISWKSLKQSIVTSSTEYAEIIACYEATGIEKPLKLYCDNESAIFYSYNNKSSNTAKYIDIKYYVVKRKIQDQTIMLEHIESERMLADPLTKRLPPKKFIEHVAGMGLKEHL